jgi:hypothetical protein
MESKSNHHRQYIPETKNGKKIKYESTQSFSTNKKKEKKEKIEENPRNKVVKEAKNKKEVKAVKEAKNTKDTNIIHKKKQKSHEKNPEKLHHQKRSHTKNKKIDNSGQNKIQEVSNTMIINMIAHNRLTKKTNK